MQCFILPVGTAVAEEPSPNVTPDNPIFERYRVQIMADPNLRNAAQQVLSNPNSTSSQELMTKGYEKAFGRPPSAEELETAKKRITDESITPTVDLSSFEGADVSSGVPPPSDPLSTAGFLDE
jgi:hypothetical protein